MRSIAVYILFILAGGSFLFFSPLGTNEVLIKSPDSAVTDVTGLDVPGNYLFELKVVDDSGAIDRDTVVVTVKAAALPVKLLYFTAVGRSDHNMVEWVSELEINILSFVVEHSEDGRVYVPIHTQKPVSAGSKTTYRCKHMYPPEHSYYRLRTIDNDNTFELSKVAYVKRTVTHGLILRNPVTTTGGAIINVTANEDAVVTVFDMTGRICIRKKISLYRGSNAFSFNAAALPVGTYALSVSTESGTTTKKFIKQ